MFSICHVQKMRGKVACLWIVSNYHWASTECLFSYITLMFTLKITTPFHLCMQVENMSNTDKLIC